MRKVIPISEVRRKNRESGGLFFAREHGSRYSRYAWLDSRGAAWFWYTNDGATFAGVACGPDGRYLACARADSPEFASSAEAEAWIKARVSV